MVAFHFQFANQAGWKCDACRKSGLEKKRRCRWLGWKEERSGQPVWGRGEVVVWNCPRSIITGKSQALLDEFLVRRRLGRLETSGMSALQVEAFTTLEGEFCREQGARRRTGSQVGGR